MFLMEPRYNVGHKCKCNVMGSSEEHSPDKISSFICYTYHQKTKITLSDNYLISKYKNIT